jgi:hypothetical protein
MEMDHVRDWWTCEKEEDGIQTAAFLEKQHHSLADFCKG